MTIERRKSDRRIPPALAEFLAEAGELAAIDLTVQNVEILRQEIVKRDARIAELEQQRGGVVPSELFDGYAVYSALSEQAKKRTSGENVSDVLNAIVKLIRARLNPPAEFVAVPFSIEEFAKRAAVEMEKHDFHGFEPTVLAVVSELLAQQGKAVGDE